MSAYHLHLVKRKGVCYYHDGNGWEERPAVARISWGSYSGTRYRLVCEACLARVQGQHVHVEMLRKSEPVA